MKKLLLSLMIVSSLAQAQNSSLGQGIEDISVDNIGQALSASDRQKATSIGVSGSNSKIDLEVSDINPNNAGSRLTQEQRDRAEALGHSVVSETLRTINDANTQQKYGGLANDAARRADAIANTAYAEKREKVLKFLGITPESTKGLYYFVSWSMPQSLLRAYAQEAMWTGGILVVRGIPDDMNLHQFVAGRAQEILDNKGASANLTIDPRLFAAYEVTAVPTIVYSESIHYVNCKGMETGSVTLQKEKFPLFQEDTAVEYNKCSPQDPNTYWKISGGVTTDFALRSFMDAGAVGAKVFHEALAKGGLSNKEKAQKPFEGNWAGVLSPEDKMAIDKAVSSIEAGSDVEKLYKSGEFFIRKELRVTP